MPLSIFYAQLSVSCSGWHDHCPLSFRVRGVAPLPIPDTLGHDYLRLFEADEWL